jgi:ribonuclease P protein subunit RPR2
MVKGKYFAKSSKEKEIAKQRIEALFSSAEEVFSSDAKLSNRYVALARKISMKYKVRIAPQLKRRFCKHCYSYLKPGSNCRVRLSGGHVTYYCLECKKFMRFPYTKEQKAKRNK